MRKKRTYKEATQFVEEDNLDKPVKSIKKSTETIDVSRNSAKATSNRAINESLPKNTAAKNKAQPNKNNNSTEIADNLLQDLTIVLTGVFEELGREKLEQFITAHGGRCTGSVSGKTNYLIAGSKLEDGREVTQGNKYKTAKAKGT